MLVKDAYKGIRYIDTFPDYDSAEKIRGNNALGQVDTSRTETMALYEKFNPTGRAIRQVATEQQTENPLLLTHHHNGRMELLS